MASFIETYTKEDKLKHIIVSSMIALYCFCVFTFIMPKYMAVFFSAVVALLVGLLKEFADYRNNKHVASRKDLIADVIGIIITEIPLTIYALCGS